MDLKLTGYEDIDKLLIDTHELLKKGEKLKKEIKESLKFQPPKKNIINE